VDLGIDLWREASEAELAVPARWSGFAVDLGFRLGRWAPHLAEHTLQVDKTLASLGVRPSEGARLARLLAAAWGRLEAAACGRWDELREGVTQTAPVDPGLEPGATMEAVAASVDRTLDAAARTAPGAG
jgi:hypothetical protein